jgi:hypothetical protein
VPLKARDVKKSLKAKGFGEENRDHFYYFFVYNGKKSPIHTKISHGETDIDDRNCASMARQIKLTNPQFKNFVDCCLTKEAYLEVLIQTGHIVPQKPR